MCKQDLALNNLQGLICHKITTNQTADSEYPFMAYLFFFFFFSPINPSRLSPLYKDLPTKHRHPPSITRQTARHLVGLVFLYLLPGFFCNFISKAFIVLSSQGTVISSITIYLETIDQIIKTGRREDVLIGNFNCFPGSAHKCQSRLEENMLAVGLYADERRG